MSTTLFKEVSYSLSKLMQDIEMGEIGLPDIQRPFVWPNTLLQMCYWHALPTGWEHMDYREFIEAHRKCMAAAIREGFKQLRSSDGE